MSEYVWPCPNYTMVSSPFGYRNGIFTPGAEFHKGVDLAAATGAPILATKAGTVLTAGWSDSFGNWIHLDHGNGITSRYGHANSLLVSAGQTVSAGQKIATVGSTGWSTGPHLHFEIIVNGSVQNPLDFVSDKDTVATSNPSNPSSAPETQYIWQSPKVDTLAYLNALSQLEMSTVSVDFNTVNKQEIGDIQVNLFIENGNIIYAPIVLDEISWTTEWKGTPGQLQFSIKADSEVTFTEGNVVRLSVDGTDLFYGFIFTQKRDKEGTIDITAYDQLRYLKNKDSYIYENKTAGQLVQMIATDFHLQCGEIANTEYVIASRLEDNCTLFDTIQNALDLTLIHEKKLYILYDDFGKLTLKNIEDMRLDVLVDNETAENYSYTSTIDSNTYNKVKIAYDNNETGKREVYVVQDEGNIKEWGVLQYHEKMQKGENPQEKAAAYLSLYNKKTRNLTIDSVLGDKRVRAGSSIAVLLDLGDMTVQNYMVVQHVKHTFTNHQHLMDLTLMGGDFSV